MKQGWRLLAERGRLHADAQLAPLTTYKLGGPARLLIDAEDESDLEAMSLGLADTAMEVVVLGRGSNVLISDAGFDGAILRLGNGFSWIEIDGDEVRAGGATPLPQLARSAAREGRGDLEFYVGIPGSVGGAVRMNAGCHGSETADVLKSARVFDLATGEVTSRNPQLLDLGYRHSNLNDFEVVVAAEFVTTPIDPEAAEAEMREVSRWRRQYQPGGTLNAGSVFKNPPGDSAGRIIDELGLKGFAVGGVSVSTKHANFIVAESGATAQDVYTLIDQVRIEVGRRTGIGLEPEIRFIGEFEDSKRG